MLLVMRRPVKVLLKSKEGFKEVPSPLRFKAADKTFINSWNLKQVLFIEGTLEITMRLEAIIKVVQSSDLVPRISPTDLGNIRVLDQAEPKCRELQDLMMQNSEDFNANLKKLVVPVRFSILALLSARKCTVFDRSLTNLIEYVLNEMTFEEGKKHLCSMQPLQPSISGGEDSPHSSSEENGSKHSSSEPEVAHNDGNEVFLNNPTYH